MSIVAFWNDDREQTGKTLTSVAVATRMAIEHNFKILLISTSYRESTTKNCFWTDEHQKKLKMFQGKKNNLAVENGIEGLAKLIKSHKLEPTVITDYTRVIFKNRLEVLGGYIGSTDMTEEESLKDYNETVECYIDLLRSANQYYDMVLIDLDNDLDISVRKKILEMSNVHIYVMTQRLANLNKYISLKETDKEITGPKCIPVIGKYNDKSKYNRKNIMRYLGEKKEMHIVPFNTLFFEAAEEANVTELFLKMKNIKDTGDTNYLFMSEVQKLTNDIITKLKELQMKMR